MRQFLHINYSLNAFIQFIIGITRNTKYSGEHTRTRQCSYGSAHSHTHTRVIQRRARASVRERAATRTGVRPHHYYSYILLASSVSIICFNSYSGDTRYHTTHTTTTSSTSTSSRYSRVCVCRGGVVPTRP